MQNNFTIDVASIATPGVVTTSGSATSAAFQINIGADITTVGNGWGAGAWGFSTWGHAKTIRSYYSKS
jgi:hypothetical protein